MIETLQEEKIKENYAHVCDILGKVDRPTYLDMATFLAWLHNTDFKTAPASSRFHLNVVGGLCQHSLNVYRIARTLNDQYKMEIDVKSIAVSCLLHDLCKIGTYKKVMKWDKEWKDKYNEWKKTEQWEFDEDQPFGHGEKSVILASKFIDLLDDEVAAIRWHLGFSDPAVHFHFPSGAPMKKCMEKYPLVQLVMMADSMAQYLETFKKEVII